VDLSIKVQNALKIIENVQMEYDQGQNHDTAEDIIVEPDGSSVKLNGNLWKAFPLPEMVEVGPDTIMSFDFSLIEEAEFQAICLDDDLELTGEPNESGAGKRCFIVANTQGWISNMINSPMLATMENTDQHFEIPIGQFFTGSFDKLVFIQDNDVDKNVGSSIFSNIEIYDQQHGGLVITVDGQPMEVPINSQVDIWISREFDQDTRDFYLDVSEDGSALQVNGNQWKGLTLPGDGIDIVNGTTLELDFSLVEKKDFHSICLMDTRRVTRDDKRCFVMGHTQSGVAEMHYLQKQTAEGETRHYSIPLWMYYTGNVKYLTFILDNDTRDKSTGKCSYRNIEIKTVPQYDLLIEEPINGAVESGRALQSETFIESIPTGKQFSYAKNQDIREHPLVISADGMEAHLKGNTWRALELPSPLELNYASELSFDFTLHEHVEVHSICFDNDLIGYGESNNKDNLKCCFTVANYPSEAWSWMYHLEPKTQEGETNHYHYHIGTKCRGTMNYLVLVQDIDNGGDRTLGNSTFSNIAVTELPELIVEINGVDTPIFNHQEYYESTQQDRDSKWMTVSDDGKSITTEGNLWKAMKLPSDSKITITDDTVLEFEVNITEMTEIHSICLDEDRDIDNGNRCFMVSGYQTNDLGDQIYQGIEYTYDYNKYQIRLSEFFSGTMEYIAFLNDNDSSDRTTGSATYSNIKVYEATSCLKGTTTNFEFSVPECTAEAFVDKISEQMSVTEGCDGESDPWAELLAFFGVTHRSQVKEKIGEICTSAHISVSLPFDQVTGQEDQFSQEYLDGGTVWNYHVDGLDQEAGRLPLIKSNFAETGVISLPDAHNFHGCELRTAMCCYVASRKAVDMEPEDNSDACYMDFKRAQQSSHVRDGYSIYGGGVEGNLNCHGFAWSNDAGYVDSVLKGNNLFHIAMLNELYTDGNVEEMPGAPMCGCIEQMPVVTRADCTSVKADQEVHVAYDAGLDEFFARVAITSITHEDCSDLSTHYDALVGEGKATEREKYLLGKHLVGEGNCGPAIAGFLGTKGFELA